MSSQVTEALEILETCNNFDHCRSSKPWTAQCKAGISVYTWESWNGPRHWNTAAAARKTPSTDSPSLLILAGLRTGN